MERKKSLKCMLTPEVVDKAFEKIKCDPEFAVDGCHYVIVREDLYQGLLDFLRDHFFPDEVLSKSIANIFPFNEELQGFVMSQVQQNITLALVSDTTGEIICARVNTISNKNEFFDIDQIKTEGIKKMVAFYQHLNTLCNVYDHYNVEEVFQFFGLGVHKDHRKKGIGFKVMKATLALIKGFGVGPVVIKGEGSSNYSKRIYEKTDFDMLAEVVYEEYKVDGEVVFKTGPEEKSEKLYAKVIA